MTHTVFASTMLLLFHMGNSQMLNDQKIELRSSDTTFYFKVSKKSVSISGEKTYYSFKNFNIHEYQGAIIGKVLDGPYQSFIKGKLISEGNFKNGLKEGAWKAWWPNGKLKEEINWKDGIPDGPFIRLDEQGNHLISGSHREGRFDGEIIRGKNKDIIRKYDNGDESNEKKKVILSKLKSFFKTKEAKSEKEKAKSLKKEKNES